MLKNLISDNRGSVTVEMALLAMVFFVMIAGLYDFGRLIVTQQRLEHAVRGGMQYGLQSQAQALDSVGIIASARAAVGADEAGMAITVENQCYCTGGGATSCDDTCADGTFPTMNLEVEAQKTYQFFFTNFFGGDGGLRLEAEAEVRAR